MNDFDLNSLFKNSWALYKERFWTIAGISIVSMTTTIIGAITIFILFFKELISYRNFDIFPSPDQVPSIILTMFSICLILGIIQLFIDGSLLGLITNNENIGPKKSFSIGVKRLFSFLWINILRFIIVVTIPIGLMFGLPFLEIDSLTVFGISLITLIFPGLMFVIWFSMAPYALFKNGLKGTKALRKSKSIIKGNFKSVLWRLFIIGATMILVNVSIISIMRIGSMINILIAPFYIIFLYHIYKSLNPEEITERSADNTAFEQ